MQLTCAMRFQKSRTNPRSCLVRHCRRIRLANWHIEDALTAELKVIHTDLTPISQHTNSHCETVMILNSRLSCGFVLSLSGITISIAFVLFLTLKWTQCNKRVQNLNWKNLKRQKLECFFVLKVGWSWTRNWFKFPASKNSLISPLLLITTTREFKNTLFGFQIIPSLTIPSFSMSSSSVSWIGPGSVRMTLGSSSIMSLSNSSTFLNTSTLISLLIKVGLESTLQ